MLLICYYNVHFHMIHSLHRMPMREDSKTLCVIEFSNKASKELIDFIIKKVEASTEDGGAELQCRLLENNTKVCH